MSDMNNAIIPIHANVEISVDPNFTTAFMEITAPQNDGNHVTEEQIKNALVEKGVYFGIDEDVLSSVVKQKRYGENICIARWVPPVDGVDGTVKFLFDKDSVIAPVEDEHGTVDYKNLGIVKNIYRGTPIAEISMPTEGTPGTDISGKTIGQHIGVPAHVNIGAGTTLSEDGTAIVADLDGNLRFSGNAFVVEEELIIKNDVDVSSGNIDFIGNIIIKGNVLEGYTVSSKRNITI
ncbi:MAG: DUF342 domain-containing protein, partial [Oscillospiraceae bacterium]|nr:DUF342 domain-containing protein [Oscillospiraceae bacterium]